MAARKAAVLDDLDPGAFGSGARNVSLNRLVRPTTLSPEAEARILGTSKTTTRQSARQMADQNAFDRSFGFTPTHSDAAILNQKKAPTSVPVTPAMRATMPVKPNVLDGVTALPAEPFNGISLASRPPMLNTDITRPGPVFPREPDAPIAPKPPGRAETFGRSVRNFLTTLPSRFRAADAAIVTDRPSTQAPATAPILDVPGAFAGFTRGLTTPAPATVPPASTPAGVTNATAAQFQVPTKEHPLPITQTSPETNIDRTQESLAKFDLSEDEQTKRKRLFAGF